MEIGTSLWPLLFSIILRLAVAALVVLIGRRLARGSRGWLRPLLLRANLTESLVVLFLALAYYGIWVVAGLAALAVLGFPVASILAAGGLVVIVLGIALQQSLKDLAATVIFLLFKPFEPGDLIETKGFVATVREIQLFNTALLRWDNKVVVLPNAEIQQSGIVNYSKMPFLRTDLTIGISYGDDIGKAKRLIIEMLESDPRVLPDPPPRVLVLALGESSIDLGVHASVTLADYWNLMFDLREQIKVRFDQEGITIPFPQRTVHLAGAASE